MDVFICVHFLQQYVDFMTLGKSGKLAFKARSVEEATKYEHANSQDLCPTYTQIPILNIGQGV